MSQFNEVAHPIICDDHAKATHHGVIETGQLVKFPNTACSGRCWQSFVSVQGAGYWRWAYRLVKSPSDTPAAIRSATEELTD